jgi:peptide/nickel transport system substrate-binding protein
MRSPDALLRADAGGEVDYIDRLDLKTLNLLQRANPNVAIAEVSGFAHYIAPMITTAAPFNDNVRLALKYAVDREQKKVLFGHGSAGNDPSRRASRSRPIRRPSMPTIPRGRNSISARRG